MNSNGKNFVFKHPDSNLRVGPAINSGSTLKRPNLFSSSLNESIYSVDFSPRKQPKTNTNQNANSSNDLQEKEEIKLSNFQISGGTQNELMITLTGNVEYVIKWNRILENQICLYEVIGRVISLQEGTIPTQKIILLRDQKGPILRVIYYSTTYLYPDIEQINLEQTLRCVGRMQGSNILHAFSIRLASAEEIETLHRNCCISERAIARLCSL